MDFYTEDKELIPTYEIYLGKHPLMAYFTSQTNVGQSPLGPEGTWVMGFLVTVEVSRTRNDGNIKWSSRGRYKIDVLKTKDFMTPREYDGVIDSDVHPFGKSAH